MAASPDLSVIISVYRADATLLSVLAALRPQIGCGIDVVVVDSTGLDHAARLERTHPWLEVVGLPGRVLPGEARKFSQWPWLTAAPALRFGALGLRLSAQPRLLLQAVGVTPLLALGLAAWTAGVAAER
jgi:hypothetical protein